MKKLILAAAIAAAGCAPPIQTSARSEIVTRAYSSMTVSLFSRPAAAVAAKAYREGNKVLLCAAIAELNSAGFGHELMARLQSTLNFHLGGEKIAQGAKFAALYGDVDGLLGRQASCAVTGVEWKETFRNQVVEIKLPRGFVGS